MVYVNMKERVLREIPRMLSLGEGHIFKILGVHNSTKKKIIFSGGNVTDKKRYGGPSALGAEGENRSEHWPKIRQAQVR